MRERDLKEQARQIFNAALHSVKADAAIRKAVKLSDNVYLAIFDEIFELTEQTSIYVVAAGKAAYPMALALDKILAGKIEAGIISGIFPENLSLLGSNWQIFAGGHPLPNKESLAAAESTLKLLENANSKHSIVLFLISGGGSAMLESPVDDSITLADLREVNKILITCGASIAEINKIRSAFSRTKGGGLANSAPSAVQISLIVSDTESGDEKSVASGMTFENETISLDEITGILEKYDLNAKLPGSIRQTIHQASLREKLPVANIRRHYVLLNSQTAVFAAAECAAASGFVVETAPEINCQNVETGCAETFDRMSKIFAEIGKDQTACLISGGEFSCPVRGGGMGGRNSETVLRMALKMEEIKNNFSEIVFLSAGTDGIDGNSPAAGAICDETTLERARNLDLDAHLFLENSDSYSFFKALRDAVITHPTGTNVRDLRLMLARK